MFSHVILCVTLDNSEKSRKKSRVSVLSPVTWRKLGQNEGKSLIFTKMGISQNNSNDLGSGLGSATRLKFGPVTPQRVF